MICEFFPLFSVVMAGLISGQSDCPAFRKTFTFTIQEKDLSEAMWPRGIIQIPRLDKHNSKLLIIQLQDWFAPITNSFDMRGNWIHESPPQNHVGLSSRT
jgi:hypothetical protein